MAAAAKNFWEELKTAFGLVWTDNVAESSEESEEYED